MHKKINLSYFTEIKARELTFGEITRKEWLGVPECRERARERERERERGRGGGGAE